jgi:hypothetical protein
MPAKNKNTGAEITTQLTEGQIGFLSIAKNVAVQPVRVSQRPGNF